MSSKSGHVSERRLCRVIGFSRSVACRPLRAYADAMLLSERKTLAERDPRHFGPTLHDMLREAGLVRNHNRSYRVDCKERRRERTRKRKKLS